MKNSMIKYACMAAMVFAAQFAWAQPGGGGGGAGTGGAPPSSAAPIDGGASVLLAGAAAYAYSGLKKPEMPLQPKTTKIIKLWPPPCK